jgi:hypothetical protein
MAKKKAKPKKPKSTRPSYLRVFLVHTKDCNWWGDLNCSRRERDPDWYEQNGWEYASDDEVNNPSYPEIDRRVEMRREDTTGTDPIIYIDMF